MTSQRPIYAFRGLREQPFWRLLTADRAPVIVGLLQVLLYDSERVLPSSALHEKLERELDLLRAHGESEVPAAAQPAIAEWLRKGWLNRRFPAGASEEEYELSTEAAEVVRFLGGLLKPRSTATESRLANVITQLWRLAEETDANPTSRLAALQAERDRIDREIAAVSKGNFQALDDKRAVERARDIIALAEGLTGDFRRVRDEFDKLNRKLRQDLLDWEGSRGDVLEGLFAGADVIAESEAGRTFAAFWDLLNDPEQSSTLTEALFEINQRPFAAALEGEERLFLSKLTTVLRIEGGGVNEVMSSLARSLKTFVKSREYAEQRRVNGLLKQAERAALETKEAVRLNQPVGYNLMLTSSRIRSVSQWHLYNPEERVIDGSMEEADASDITLDQVSELVRQSEIDFRTLREHLRAILERRSQATIAQVLEEYPAEQGLGSVIGYISIGARHGLVLEGERELVGWEGKEGALRCAWVPTIYFYQERLDELAA